MGFLKHFKNLSANESKKASQKKGIQLIYSLLIEI